MASKENLTPEAYDRQIAGLTPWRGGDRQTSKRPVKIFLDQEERINAIAQKEKKSKAEVVREAIDYYLDAYDTAA